MLKHQTHSPSKYQGSSGHAQTPAPPTRYLPIMLESQLLGRVHINSAAAATAALRSFKLKGGRGGGGPIDTTISTLEIALIFPDADGRFPGLYLFCRRGRFPSQIRQPFPFPFQTQPLPPASPPFPLPLPLHLRKGSPCDPLPPCSNARFLRPVLNLKSQQLELIGPLEQTTLRIAYSQGVMRHP